MSLPSYNVAHSDRRVRIFVNGKPVVDSNKQHQHAFFINFVGENAPVITVNKTLGTYDIRLPICDCMKKKNKEEDDNDDDKKTWHELAMRGIDNLHQDKLNDI